MCNLTLHTFSLSGSKMACVGRFRIFLINYRQRRHQYNYHIQLIPTTFNTTKQVFSWTFVATKQNTGLCSKDWFLTDFRSCETAKSPSYLLVDWYSSPIWTDLRLSDLDKSPSAFLKTAFRAQPWRN